MGVGVASHVCLSCVPLMCASHVCLSCVPLMYASHVCLSCMPLMCASHVCLSCMPLMCASHVCCMAPPMPCMPTAAARSHSRCVLCSPAGIEAAAAGSPFEAHCAPADETDMLLRSQMLTMYYQVRGRGHGESGRDALRGARAGEVREGKGGGTRHTGVGPPEVGQMEHTANRGGGRWGTPLPGRGDMPTGGAVPCRLPQSRQAAMGAEGGRGQWVCSQAQCLLAYEGCCCRRVGALNQCESSLHVRAITANVGSSLSVWVCTPTVRGGPFKVCLWPPSCGRHHVHAIMEVTTTRASLWLPSNREWPAPRHMPCARLALASLKGRRKQGGQLRAS